MVRAALRNSALVLGLTIVSAFVARGQDQDDGARSICTVDDRQEAACYAASEPAIYQHSRAVARLVIGGTLRCTGWLVGDEGYLLTAGHCIPTASAAAETQVELGAEGATCAVDCGAPLACPGEIVAATTTLIKANADLDYSLVKLPVNPTAEYGYLLLRPSGAELGERVYLPQHPGGFGKRIAVTSTYPADVGGFPHVVSMTEPPCHEGATALHVGTFADMTGGASGSPLVAYSDHRVIGIHACHGELFCVSGEPGSDDPNRAVPVPAIVADLGTLLPPSALYERVFRDDFESGDTSAWSEVVP